MSQGLKRFRRRHLSDIVEFRRYWSTAFAEIDGRASRCRKCCCCVLALRKGQDEVVLYIGIHRCGGCKGRGNIGVFGRQLPSFVDLRQDFRVLDALLGCDDCGCHGAQE